MGNRRKCPLEVQKRLREQLKENPLPPCPECGASPQVVTGEKVYPLVPRLHEQKYWKCPNGCSYVGCHPGTDIPLGTLATASMRRARQEAHAAFDGVWNMCGMERMEAYTELAKQLGIPVERCHIAEFDEATCARVVAICAGW